MRSFRESFNGRAPLLALGLVATFLAMQASAAAAPLGDDDELWRSSGFGIEAGQLRGATGVASDPVTGHILVTEEVNNRVSEFTPWGKFVKAFGWDVAPEAVNESQEVRVRASEGEFRLKFGEDTTTDLPHDASGSEVEAALNALPSISSGGVSVVASTGNPNGETPYVYAVTFKGSLAGADVAQLEAEEGTIPLDGGDPATELEVRTRADGHSPTEGLEACTAESGCQAGTNGSGVGQLARALGVAVDATGHIYLREASNLRVQKFDHAGRFVLMFGGKVNETTGGNRCPEANGDVCVKGVAGVGNGEFGDSNSSSVVLGAGEKLFTGDVGRIQRFSLEGDWENKVNAPEGKTVHDLAIAPGSGDFYATVGSSQATEEDVRILDAATGAEKGKLQANELKDKKGDAFPATKATGGPVATNVAGEVFARRNSPSLGEEPPAPPLVQFDPDHNQISEFGEALPTGTIGDFGTNGAGDLHVASEIAGVLTAFGPLPLLYEGPPSTPPEILSQFATSVQRDGATVAAEINPHLFPDATYRVQYGTSKCSEGGCTQEQPLAGTQLTTKTIDAPVRAAGIFLEGLAPGTTYHYRFIAVSGGGGPVYGIDPDGEGEEKEASPSEGLEATFITLDPIGPKSCFNDVFRGGGAARLPNCRAYEMVSPLDKNNGDIKALVNIQGYSTMLGQSAPDGGRMAYSAYRAFADPKAAPFTLQLLATRGADGWSSEALNPSQGPGANVHNDFLDNNFKAFSEDLCLAWLVAAVEPQLDPPTDIPDYRNIYKRDNCEPGKENYEALSPALPTLPRNEFYPEFQGASASGEAAIFRVDDILLPAEAGTQLQCATLTQATTISYQWLRNGVAIGGATASTYTITAADAGQTVQCQLTAANANAGSTQVANPAVVVAPPPATALPRAPEQIAAPTSSAVLTVGDPGGQVLSCDPGESDWSGASSFSYQWYRNGAAIAGATASTYVVTAGDLASAAVFQCAVVGANPGGGVTKVSANLATSPSPAAPVADASMPKSWQAYYATPAALAAEEVLKPLCVLPDGNQSTGNCSGGTGAEDAEVNRVRRGRMANVENAISDDGTRVYWTDSGPERTGAGKVYLRLEPSEPQSASGCEAGKACTVPVSQEKSEDDSRFLVATPDGSKALFEVTEGSKAGNLYEFRLGASTRTIAGEVLGLAGASEDLSKVYFVSEEALEGAAVEGEPNLYLKEGNKETFIAELSEQDSDAGADFLSVTAPKPVYHAARASADGSTLAFVSNADLTDYDNTDQETGEQLSEVYVYEAGSAGPACVSCSPGRARPLGREVKVTVSDPASVAMAATLPMATTMLHAPRAISADGSRLFFNSFDPLLPRDTNSAADLYMWESASDKAACAALGAELYVAAADGCISLISTGESPEDSEFLDASANGDDVFFITNASLLPQDPGLFDLYDARVGGGFPPPPVPAPDCLGETCKPAAAAPSDPSPASSTYVGPGDVEEKAKKKAKKKKKKAKGKKKRKGKGKKGKGGKSGRAAR
jgi:hypothetical protein